MNFKYPASPTSPRVFFLSSPSMLDSRASLPIKFIVVGASVSGLACGYALRKAGHEVVLLEKTDGKIKTEGAIRSPPNMTRILSGWPDGPAFLKQHATKCSGISLRRGDTLEPMGYMKLYEQIMSELQADFLILQHDDLRRYLTSICLASGVVIKYACQAVEVKLTDGSVNIVVANGNTLHGDIVVGADGHNSLVRGIVAEGDLEATHTVTGASISISTKDIRKHLDFQALWNPNEFTLWMGNGSNIIGTLDPNAETLNIAICAPTNLGIAEGDGYTNKPLANKMPFDLSGYDTRLQKLIQLGHICYPTVQHVFEQDDVVGLDGMAVLVGDAAHSVLIHGSHNSSMAMEDAATLGCLFSRLSNRKQIPMLLHAYHEIRHSRTSSTQDSEYQWLVQTALPPGTLRDGRDATLNATLSKAFEDFDNCGNSEMIQQMWAEYLVMFGYNAAEEVDNWRSMWGSVVDQLV
ncbi:hypothetical protein DFH07DRAFT_130586 [Mycena maculata]|uniref:FAD-binding domain-containing protein n=1 Tax=Mycena maculata TaxID=230809 RepID=A0AAD7I4I0_9AGAR|nr:hypothetical protein DFH07DRAFT_130586 [Mycena maculata]